MRCADLEWEMGDLTLYSAISGGAFDALGIKAVLKAEGNLEGSLEYACCEEKKSRTPKVSLGGTSFLGAELEGRIWGWDWHIAVDGAIGVYGTVKVGGQIGLSGAVYDACKDRTSGEFTGSLLVSGEVAGKAQFNGCVFGSCANVLFKPLAVGIEGGFGFKKATGEILQRNDFVTVYLRGEIELNDTRKLQLVNLSKTWNNEHNGGSLERFLRSLAN